MLPLNFMNESGYGECKRAYIPETNHFLPTPIRVETALFGLARLRKF